MAQWTDVSRNLRKHGDFAGRSQREQDAYFAFFAGGEAPALRSLVISRIQMVLRLPKLADRLSLDWKPWGVSPRRVTNQE